MTESQLKMIEVLQDYIKWVERGNIHALGVVGVHRTCMTPPTNPAYPKEWLRAQTRHVVPDEATSPEVDLLVAGLAGLREQLLPHTCATCKGEHRLLYCPAMEYDPEQDTSPAPFNEVSNEA